ncbi:MAG: DUF6868 family protein [Planctomycetota bacterium]|jgi:hypothetical protein
MTRDEQNNLLETLAGICLRCFALSISLLVVWFVFYLIAGSWAYSIHSRWFNVDEFDFELMCYYGMAFIKMVAFIFFLFPYISIKLVLRKR